jgi:three-Cys-motif partner protein
MSELDDLYDGREQTLVKHRVLDRYLQRFAYIIGSWNDSITYVDCYSGPWAERSADLSDTSFSIAINQLKAAKRELGRNIRLRCLFIEKDPDAYGKLASFASTVDDVEIHTINARFEDSVDDIIAFVAADRNTFPFFLIDPKGWSIPLEIIAPLLRQQPGEVLITFMLEFIRRFADHPQPGIQKTIDDLYGEPSIARRFDGVVGEDRENLLLNEYVKQVQKVGDYNFASSSLVLHPEKSRRHFHLVYLTRHHRGIEVFKDAERKAMADMETARAMAAKRKRESKGQIDLFPAEVLHNNEYFDGLRERYLASNSLRMLELLQSSGIVAYDELWSNSLRSPLIWPSDVNSLLAELVRQGRIELIGLRERQRVPKFGSGNQVQFVK